ncbi:MAG TPA: serine/threonine-protein kinase, partial [Candidatus Sulfopaludibacter sp.]|nr:serine/threonine-protein kinase [Candidatus Sulfopaludibacter sp.]
FVPGTLLGGRYRIIALLGRGGMGEVYRATDLTLGQSVALKFLPEEAARDQRLLERFHGEVRIARQVSHPNVCRVYDIGQAGGAPFISMEYVDGEDLASLLTRIGRLPADKALEIARKICAGLAAAHDRGIIHRDLKPQNIMLNKRGEVIIMDFGLAAIASTLGAADARSGTPAYMAPEQLKGAEVTARSDIYALGLVLYELFTGKRPFDAKTVRQMLDLQEAAQLTSMTSIAADIDPAVEKAVRRCLDPEPMKRPATALWVAAALPGGDPLAAALAAGETPSPELVAAAGDTAGLARRYSIPCLIVVVVGLVSSLLWREYREAMMRTPLDLPPQALAVKAREIARDLGYPRRPADFVISLDNRDSYIDYMNHLPEPRKWNEWLAYDAPIGADYRESQLPLVARPDGQVGNTNPPPIVPGMAYVRLDGRGHLLEFSAIPYAMGDDLKEPVPPQTVFRDAGLDFAAFTEAAPPELPTGPADQVRAWKGPHPVLPKTELMVEVATFQGRVTRMHVIPPWAKPSVPGQKQSSLAARIRDIYGTVLIVVVLVFAILFARRNWKLGRADRKGALQVAAARFVLAAIAWVGTVHAVPTSAISDLFSAAVGDWLLSAGIIWLFYMALEPAVRSRWPHSIVTWNRILAGRWLDPQVGSHILIGAAVSCLIWELFAVPSLFVAARDTLESSAGLYWILGTRRWFGGHAIHLAQGLTVGMAFFFGLFFVRTLLKRDWLAAVAASLLGIWLEGSVFSSDHWQLTVAIYLVIYFALFMVMLRFGLVATISAVFFVNSFQMIVIGLDWTTWYAPYGLATLVFLLAIAFGAFWRSLGSQTLFGGEAAEGA